MNKKNIYFFLLLACMSLSANARSHHRPKDHTLPKITLSWAQDNKKYTLSDSHLEAYPFFKIFDKSFFESHLLPEGSVNFRYHADQAVDTKHLNTLIEEFVTEIKQKKRSYKNFVILSQKNFNKKRAVGMIICKFKDYPFVLKLCIETPKSFISPFGKGLDNVWFFPIGGGINRHLAGFTRIKNLDVIKNRIAAHPTWSNLFDFPRKWYWLPENSSWLAIKGENIGGYQEIETEIPAVYAIVADEIHSDKQLTLFDREYTKITMDLGNYLDHWLDSHIDNFLIETDTKKIVIVDTEHFPSVIGIKEKVTFENYLDWFVYLASKFTKELFFRTKKERVLAQTQPHLLALT